MRVVIASHGYGDSERFKLLEGLAAEHEVILLAPDRIWTPVFGDFFAPEGSYGVTVVHNRPLRFHGGHYLFRPSWRAWRQFRPDLLQVEYDPWTPEFWSVVLPMLLLHPRTPIVLYSKKNTRHIGRGPTGWVERLLTWLGLSRVRMIMSASNKTAAIFQRLGYGHIPVRVQAQLPIDETLFVPQVQPDDDEADSFTVGFVGSIAPHKGIHALVEAVESLRRRLAADVRLALVGPMRDLDLAHLFARHSWVDYRGPMDNADVPRFLATVDAFVMPSELLHDHEEHDGQALLEAMATMRACIGSRSGIIPELLEDGHTGLLFDPDDVEGLADCLEKLFSDPELRHRLGQNARGAALQRTGLRSLVRQRLDAYRDVRVA